MTKQALTEHAEAKMALIEKDARRMAAALKGYDHLRVDAVVEIEPAGFQVEFSDLRFDETFAIASHFDYWDFLGYFSSHQMWPAKTRPRVA